MNRVLLSAAVVLLAGASYGAPPSSCDLQGTWIGQIDPVGGGGRFLSSYHGRTRIEGTTDLQFFDLPPDPFGAAALTEAKGSWKRTGPRAYSYTVTAFGLDAAGSPIYRVVNSGIKTLTEDCSVMEIEAYIQYFTPEGDPITGCFGPLPASADRLDVDPHCQP